MSDSTAIVHHKLHLPQTPEEIKAQIVAIQAVMRGVMKPEVHYGTIPGTDKPTLYKAGSEVLLATFRISVQPEIEDLSTADEIRYRVHCKGIHMTSGTVVGIGLGEASTNEEKYKWKGCGEAQFEDTPEDRRRLKYGWKWGENQGERLDTKIQQVRTEPADLANTVLKMAKKRAQIDMTLTALAASDVFTQDMDDVPEDLSQKPVATQRKQSSAPKRAGNGKANERQIALLKVKADQAGVGEVDVWAQFNITSWEQMPFREVNACLAWLKEMG